MRRCRLWRRRSLHCSADLVNIDMQPVRNIRGLVHVVGGDYEIRSTSAYSDLGTEWEHHWFYLNRFKQPARDALYSVFDI
jgi:hypothetical protein